MMELESGPSEETVDSMDSPTAVEQTFDLEYSDEHHGQSILTSFCTLQKNRQFCDARLVVGAHEIPVHRALLASVSSYLFDLFSRKENETNTYKLKDVDYDSFQHLLNFAYTGRLDIPAIEVKSVYWAAMQLKIHSVARACSSYLAMNLTPTNCLGVRSYAADQELKDTLNCFIQDNINEVITSKNFFGLPRVQIEIIVIAGVDDDIVAAGDEKHMFMLVLNWAMENVTSSKRGIVSLTEQVNVLYLNPDNTLSDSKFGNKNGELDEEDIVTDYRNLSKKKQGSPGSQSEINEQRSPNFHKFDIPPETLPSQHEWSVIASFQTKDRSYMSIAVLNGTLATISLHYRKPLSSSVSSSEGPDSPVGEMAGSQAKLFERHTSLTPLAFMDTPRCAFGLRLLNGKLFACGGYNRGECLKTTEIFDLAENTWESLPEMNCVRGRFSVAAVDGKIYACGGSDGQQQLKSCECYYPEERRWREITDLPNAVASPGIVEFQDKLYCVGGCVGKSCIANCLIYNQQKDVWTVVAPLNAARYQSGLCEFAGKLYVIGGTDGWNCLNSVEVYDPEVGQWQFTTPLTTARRGAGMDVLNGMLYVVGGSDGAHSLRTVEIYDPESKLWAQGPGLSIARANVGVATYANRLFAVGGFNGRRFLDSIEYLDMEINEWCSYVPSGAEMVPFENSRNLSVKKSKKHCISSDFNDSVDTCSNKPNSEDKAEKS